MWYSKQEGMKYLLQDFEVETILSNERWKLEKIGFKYEGQKWLITLGTKTLVKGEVECSSYRKQFSQSWLTGSIKKAEEEVDVFREIVGKLNKSKWKSFWLKSKSDQWVRRE